MPLIKDILLVSPLSSRFETELLLAHLLRKTREFVIAHPEYEFGPKEGQEIMAALARRAKNEPFAYITGHKEFYGLEFKVTPATLIPRPETELMVELAIDRIRNYEWGIMNGEEKVDIIDIGTGSGNIVISLAKEVPSLIRHTSYVNFFGIDLSLAALAVAKENAITHHVQDDILFLAGDLLVPYLEMVSEMKKNILITANLPYLSETLYANAPEDVQKYEPKSALYSDNDGLEHYQRLLKMISIHRKSFLSITLFFEISPEQSASLTNAIRSLFLEAVVLIHQDLAGKDRAVETRLS